MLGLLGLFVFVSVLAYFAFGGRGRMTQAISPDKLHRITLDETSGRLLAIDRNFNILLWDHQSGSERKIGWPRSVDQSPLITREHFVWSPDSRYAALVGDRYFVTDEAKLASGDQILLVYDTKEDVFYSNYDREDPFEPFPADRAVEVFGDRILRPAPVID